MDPKAIESLVSLVVQGGAIAVLVWVVTLLTGGKLHTNSEVEGLRKDKADLLVVNKSLSDALADANELLRLAVERHR